MTKTYKMEDARGRRLFADINHAFKRDPLIDEYDFLPVTEPQHNASPLVLVEHKLGLELWSVRILFRYAYNRLMNWRDKSQSSPFLDGQELSHLSRTVLLINPDCYTAWNIRKELVESGDLSMAEDLKLGRLILTKFPKSAETFIHRRWLFQRLVNQCLSSSNDSCTSSDSFQDNGGALLCMDGIDIALGPDAGFVANGSEAEARHQVRENRRVNTALPLESSRLLAENLHGELRVCEGAADGYCSNYYAWTHRAWVVRYCFNCSLQPLGLEQADAVSRDAAVAAWLVTMNKAVLLKELEATQTWTRKHISDHSGFHYRQFLLSSVSQHASRLHRQYGRSVSDLVDAEHDSICDLIHNFPAHEALWYHRRNVFHMMMTSAKTHSTKTANVSTPINGATQSSVGAASRNDGQKRSRLESHSPHALRQQEMDSVQKTARQTKDAYQKALAAKYVDWLEKLFPACKES